MNDSPRKGRPFGRRPRDPNRRPVVLHECRACGAKWLAPRPVPVCPGCRCDDACGGKGPILRRRGYEALGPDGVWRVALKLVVRPAEPATAEPAPEENPQ